jgi:hypothetical protein
MAGFNIRENRIYITEKNSSMSEILYNKDEDTFELPKIIYKAA